MNPAPIIITGMHRSGTSLVARMLRAAGIHLGDRLLGPGPSNPHGYFEDLDFVDLHEAILADLGASIYLGRHPDLGVPPRFGAPARELVSARSDRSAWWWKDPRTSLFLDFWSKLVPEARFVFVYRPPAEVAGSLRRRRDVALHLQFPGAGLLERLGAPRFRVGRALSMWCRYNERIVAFAESRRDRCAVVPFAEAATTVPAVLARLRAEGVPVHAAEIATLVDPALATSPVPANIERRSRRDGRAAQLMRRLDALSGAGT